jgi:hypothetical protein
MWSRSATLTTAFLARVTPDGIQGAIPGHTKLAGSGGYLARAVRGAQYLVSRSKSSAWATKQFAVVPEEDAMREMAGEQGVMKLRAVAVAPAPNAGSKQHHARADEKQPDPFVRTHDKPHRDQ